MEKKELQLNFFDRIKTEIAAALIIGGMLLAIMLPISGLSLPGDLSYGILKKDFIYPLLMDLRNAFLRWY